MARRDAKRSKPSPSPAEGLLSRPLLRSHDAAAVPALASFLRAHVGAVPSTKVAKFILTRVASVLLFTLHHEQRVLQLFPPPASSTDGVASCIVGSGGTGWRRVCDMCSATLFNARVSALDDGADDGFEVCVDCWAANARGELSWPKPRRGAGVDPAALRVHSDFAPELLAEMSLKAQSYLDSRAVGEAAAAVAARLPLPAPRSGKPVSALPAFSAAPKAPAPRAPAPKAPAPKAPAPKLNGVKAATAAVERNGGQACKTGARRGCFEDAPDGTPCPDVGAGWMRVTRKRPSDPTGRHVDHTWISPSGVRFNSRVHAARGSDQAA